MKILVVSDLHLEYYSNFTQIEAIINSLDKADIICLCGDIVSLSQSASNFYGYPINPYIFRLFAAKYKHVIYVKGNHEFWNAPNWEREEIKAITNVKNVYFLENDKITIEGQEFIGATMWYAETAETISRSFTFADFCYIDGHMDNVWDVNKKTQKYFEENVNKNSIVLTHHLPTMNSVAPIYKHSDINCFFVCDWAHKIVENNQPKIWLHGHTHSNCDYSILNTRIICNPYGYPFELNGLFNPSLIIEV
jgi:predicted phosphodiesterase